MVCLSESIKRQSFVDRAELLGLSLARAEFLAACSHTQVARNEANRTNLIPYDPAVLIREAFRIGIGLKDAAKMMEMTHAEVMAYGLPFPARSIAPAPCRGSEYNLFLPEPIRPNVCYR
jgi:hypothetical protein